VRSATQSRAARSATGLMRRMLALARIQAY
jgi:hypothetical protein